MFSRGPFGRNRPKVSCTLPTLKRIAECTLSGDLVFPLYTGLYDLFAADKGGGKGIYQDKGFCSAV